MQYAIVFLEGIITFVSPCLLPMLPIYLSYLAGSKQAGSRRTLQNAFGFVLGFTIVFMLLGLFAGFFGSLLVRYGNVLNVVMGIVVITMGLSFLNVIKLPNLSFVGVRKLKFDAGFITAVLFGMVFSLSFSPCVGAFLGSALALASQQGSAAQGALMLLAYSVGLGIPFMLSAALMESLKSTLLWFQKHDRTLRMVSGVLLVLMGIAMMTGWYGKLLALLA